MSADRSKKRKTKTYTASFDRGIAHPTLFDFRFTKVEGSKDGGAQVSAKSPIADAPRMSARARHASPSDVRMPVRSLESDVQDGDELRKKGAKMCQRTELAKAKEISAHLASDSQTRRFERPDLEIVTRACYRQEGNATRVDDTAGWCKKSEGPGVPEPV